MSFNQYVEHGWMLCPIRDGEKAPRGYKWNVRENGVTSPQVAANLSGAGLMHAFSGTCAIDIDDMDLARAWLRERGIDLDALFAADDAVQIVRGDKSRGKLIYALPVALPTKQIKNDDKTSMVLEFRCGATTGNSAQDVLPPTVHPSGARYEWKFNNDLTDWRTLPALPKPLHDLWLSMVRVEPALPSETVQTATPANLEWVERYLAAQNPDCDYDTWRDIGMRLHDGTQGGMDGFALWDAWSARGTKYPGSDVLLAKWDTFGQGTGPQATLDGLRREVTASDADFGPPVDQDLLTKAIAQEHEAKLALFQWIALDDVLKRPPPAWLIKRVLPDTPINMIYGPSGAGKSFVAFDMAQCIVRGIPWRGQRVKQGNVCWFAAEAEGSMRNRGVAYRMHNGLDAMPGFFVLGAGPNLRDRDTMRALAESAAALKPVLVIIDTLAAASGGANENSGEDMGPVMDNCALVAQITGASVLLIHHSGKDESKGSRGWSGIKARLDAQIEVRKREPGDEREIIIDKMRDGQEGDTRVFVLRVIDLGVDDDGDKITSVVCEHVEQSESPVPNVRTGQGKWHKAIREALCAAPTMELESEALILAAIERVPEPERTQYPRKRVVTTLHEMVDLGELRAPGLAGTGSPTYGFRVPSTIAGSPDPVETLLSKMPDPEDVEI